MNQVLVSVIIFLSGIICILLFRIIKRKNKEGEEPRIKILRERSFESYLNDLKYNIRELDKTVRKRKSIIERELGIYGR